MRNTADQSEDLLYSESLSSRRTEALFLALMSLFFLFFLWRTVVWGMDALAVVLLCFFVLFLFYSLNYRTLTIRLTAQSLKLTFGIFTWVVSLENVEACNLDELPVLMRNGGAGIHFMTIRQRYRVSFNFLEYPRVVVALKRKQGLVRDVSFSTHQPEEVMRIMCGIMDG
jgi:hypothetical protein